MNENISLIQTHKPFLDSYTIEIGKKLNIIEKYDKLLEKYSPIKTEYTLHNDEFKNIINSLGYKCTQSGSTWYKISLGKSKSGYNTYCHLAVRKNTNFIQVGVYLKDRQQCFGGSMLGVLYSELTNRCHHHLYFRNQEDLKYLLKDILTLASEFKNI